MQTPENSLVHELAAPILVVLDKPKHAQTGLQRARRLAQAAGAHLHLVSFCWLPMATRADVFDTHQRRALRKSVVADRRRWLDGLLLDQKLSAADVSTEVVWTDDIGGWIADWAAVNRPALVVKSVHKSRTLLHTPLDWTLLRSCPAPLLLAATGRRRASGQVLAALDANQPDARHRKLNREVAALAAWFAGLTAGTLHGVTVVEDHPSFRELDFFDSRKVRRESRDGARALLQEQLGPLGVSRRRMHLPAGKVGQAVAEVAGRTDADVVVVGTGVHRAVGERLLGASAEKILGRVGCDVLAVPVR